MHCLRHIPTLCEYFQLDLNLAEWLELYESTRASKPELTITISSPSTPQVQPSSESETPDFGRLQRLQSFGSTDDASSGGGTCPFLERMGSFQQSLFADSDGQSVDNGSGLGLGEDVAADPDETGETHETDQVKQLKKELADVNQRLTNSRKKNKQRVKTIARLQEKVEKLKGFIGIRSMRGLKRQEQKKDKINASSKLAIVKKGIADRNLTSTSTIAVAIRMALSCCSALGFPAASWTDISRQTVSRCEVNIAATCAVRGALIGHILVQLLKTSLSSMFQTPVALDFLTKQLSIMKRFHTDGDETNASDSNKTLRGRIEVFLSLLGMPPVIANMLIPTSKAVDTPCVLGISLQNDATNSSIWQRRKLTSAVVHAGILVDLESLQARNYKQAFFVEAFM